jgi:ketosteroid isomerase-like protein
MKLRNVVIAGAVAALAIPFVAYGSWSKSSATDIQKQADMFQIEKIEKSWHRATSTKNLDLMMSFWSKNAVFTFSGATYRGKSQLRAFFSKIGPFQPQNDWISDTPAYKIKVTVHGSKGTLYFECHYLDYATKQLKSWGGINLNVQKIKGQWLAVNGQGSTPVLKP